MNDDPNENIAPGYYRINNNKITISKSFEYNRKIIGSTPADNNTLDKEVVAPLNYLSNFWRSLDLPLINWQIELDLRCTTYHTLAVNLPAPAEPANQQPEQHFK